MEKILNAFETYEELFHSLYKLMFEYHNTFGILEQQIIKESILNEEVSEEEKRKIESKLSSLESDISKVLISLANHLNLMKTLLKKENEAIQEKVVNKINRMHISTMSEYNNCVVFLKDLKKNYEDWDFSKVDFSKVDSEKMKLNIAIKKYNNTNLLQMDYKLKDVFEAQKIAKEEASEI